MQSAAGKVHLPAFDWCWHAAWSKWQFPAWPGIPCTFGHGRVKRTGTSVSFPESGDGISQNAGWSDLLLG